MYSKYLDGAFCLPYLLFGKDAGRNCWKLDKLFKSPLTYWSSARLKLLDHENKSQIYLIAMLQIDHFVKVMERKGKPTDLIIDITRRLRMSKNREILKPIFQAAVFCEKQNIALRGHRNDSINQENKGRQNIRNFQELLDFSVQSGDKIFKRHLKMYQEMPHIGHKRSKKEIIKICGKHISNRLIEEIKKNKLFWILAYEATDVTNRQEMVLVI